jgi:polysaccharide export outer membrane protein
LLIKGFYIKHLLKSITLVLPFLLLFGCTVKDDRLFQHENAKNQKLYSIPDDKYESEEVSFEYKIAPNDRLLVTVYVQSGAGSQQMNSILASRDTSGNNTKVQDSLGLLVTQKGTIRLPLINSVKVVGLTEDEASKVLIAEYKKYIRNPYVTVEITNQRVVVIGEVKKPGVVPIVNGTMNLIEVISRSGYLTPLASRTNIQIIRGDLRHPEVRKINLTDGESLLTSSLLLKPNDIVYVQARQMDGYNKAFEEAVPFFATISAMLNPFVQMHIIRGDVYQNPTQ